MKNKRASAGEIVIWLIVFIVGSLIVTFIVSPDSFGSFKSNVKSVIPSTTSMGTTSSSSSSQVKDTSLVNCQSEIKEKARIAKEKSVLDLDIDVREYKKFNDTMSALEYMKDWNIIGNVVSGYPNPYPEFFINPYEDSNFINLDITKQENNKYIIEQDNIIIFLVRFEFSSGGESAKMLRPIICIDGKLTDSSKSKFNVF